MARLAVLHMDARHRGRPEAEHEAAVVSAEELAEEFLARASELLESGWCQGASARDAIGEPIDASSVFARRWSIGGALERVWRRGTFDPDVALSAFVRASLALAGTFGGDPQRWNDEEGRTLDQTLDALLDAEQLVNDRVERLHPRR
ncbi:MAG: DUF6197 family protein [Gaiellaceae bacterium]